MKAWAAGICAFAVAAGMLRLLAPKGSVVRMFRLVLCGVMLCVVLGPLFHLFPQFRHALSAPSGSEEPSSSFAEAVETQSLTAMEERLQALAAQTLEDASIPYTDLSVKLSYTEDYEVVLQKLELTVPAPAFAAQAKDILKEKLGLDAEVITNGG